MWPQLAAWSGLELVSPLAGGARNPVHLARRGGERLVVRRSGRPEASLAWELDLLAHLARHGVGVPAVVPADDGRRHVDGVVVHAYVTGGRPDRAADWRRVVATLTRVHELTTGWPQRPGFASAADLLAAERGGDVRLDLMPEEAVAVVRDAWRPVLVGPPCVVHADVGPGNIAVDGDRVTLLDWDEARVDVPWFDFALLPEVLPEAVALPPEAVALPVPVDRGTLVTAGAAWEAATCWAQEPEYASRRLEELRRRTVATGTTPERQ
jgi:Ser/Thr protein kinase RdoA (MazF antagonist)